MRSTVIAGHELSDADAAAWCRVADTNAALASPYFQPGFCRAVAAVRDDVRVAILEDAGDVVGYFPFQRGRFGRGRPVGGPVSDYQGVITARNDGWDAADVVRSAGLASFDFDHMLSAQTPFAPFASAMAGSPVMDLASGYDAYVAERRAAGSKQIQGLGTLRRKFEREIAPLRFEPFSTDTNVLRKLVAWKTEQCLATGGIDIFSARWTNELVERLLHTKEDGFGGTLSALWAGDRLVAAHFGMRSRTVWHYWFPSYDEEFAKFSPGLQLLLCMAETAPSLGITAIDLGKGEAPYKERMASRAVQIAEGSVEIPSIPVRARHLRRSVELWAKTSPIAAPARVPGRALKRFERWLRFQ